MTEMNCTACQEALEDCLDTEQPLDDALARHLAGCDACRQSWAFLQASRRAFASEPARLSAEGRARVLAYAAAHAPAQAGAAAVVERRPRVWWFWGLSMAVLALLLWRWSAEPTVAPPRTEAGTAMAHAVPRSLPPTEATALTGTPSGPTATVNTAAPDERSEEVPAPKEDAAAALPVARPLRGEPSETVLAERERPSMKAASEPSAPVQEEVAVEAQNSPMVAMGGAAADSVAVAPSPAPTKAAAPTVAAAPRARAEVAMERDARPELPSRLATPAPSLDPETRKLLVALSASSTATGQGWTLLRAAAAAPRLSTFESVVASCAGDALLCEAAALGAGAMRLAAGRSDATPLLQRAAASADAAVASAARRLLAAR